MNVPERYYFDGTKSLSLKELDTKGSINKTSKEEILKKTEKNLEKLSILQEKLYADGREGVVLVIQAMDAAGKDSTVKHVMSGVNPQGVDVHSFKNPTTAELAHGFLWRIEAAAPERGKIAIFNRSHYEDVLVVKVHGLNRTYKMPERCTGLSDEEFFARRYEDIRGYEKYLYNAGYRVVKVFLNVSLEEQKERFLERIDRQEKNWKFSAGDLKERALWGEYQKAIEEAVNSTATETAPWYVLPADRKWYTRYLVSEILVSVLEDIDPQFPEVDPETAASLADCKAALLAEEDEAKAKEPKVKPIKKKAKKAAEEA